MYFYVEEPSIWIGFQNEDGWGQPIYRLLEDNAIKSGRLFSAPVEEDNAYWFMFKIPASFNELTLPKQEKLLKRFFENVVMAIYNTKSHVNFAINNLCSIKNFRLRDKSGV